MPEHRPGPDAPARAALATIERIKKEILSNPDPETLNAIRAAFRREIPLHLRSYAAALLILEASGSREGRKPQRDQRRNEEKRGESRDGRKSGEARSEKSRSDRSPKPEGQVQENRLDENRPRFQGEGSTIFFGMGKRQRLYPRVLYRILTEEAGLAPEEIGDIRSFDNYSFADVDPLKAEELIEKINGYAFRGRGLPVSKARKRGAAEDEGGLASEVGSASTESFPEDSYDETLDEDSPAEGLDEADGEPDGEEEQKA